MANLQSLCTEPNVVVGLVSSALAGKGPSFANKTQRLTIGTDDHLRNCNSERLVEASRGLCNVMDAIVEVAALSSENAVLACGMRRHDATSVVELVLCSLTPISPATVQHINRIWDLMVEVSTLRDGQNVKTVYMNFDCTLLDFALPDLRRNFKKDLSIQLEWKKVSDSIAAHPSPNKKSFRNDPAILICVAAFADVVECMSACNTLLQDMSTWNPNALGTAYDEWTKLREGMAKLRLLIDHLMGLESFRAWGNIATGLQNFTLQIHLKRIARSLGHIKILRDYARSKRHKDFFGRPLRITTLKPQHPDSDVMWPSLTLPWTDVRDHLYHKYRRLFIGNDDSHNFSLLPDRPDELVVHPELAIFSYLHALSVGGGDPLCRPYNYIAVSGLACKACSLWVRAYNNLRGSIGFGISGSHNEWVTGWCMPELGRDNDKLRRDFVRICLEVYFPFARDAKIAERPEPPIIWPGLDIRETDFLHRDYRMY